MAPQFPGELLRQRGEVNGEGAQSVEAEHGIGFAGGADERPGHPAPYILAGLARQITVQLGKSTGQGHLVVPSSERLENERIEPGQREAARRSCSSRAARRRSFGGGGSESASKNRIAFSRASAIVS